MSFDASGYMQYYHQQLRNLLYCKQLPGNCKSQQVTFLGFILVS